jgi:Na+-translocating ferredoxin:NAD+ oxidoreductase RNF subunit RnfB
MKSAFNRRSLFALLGRPLQRTMEPARVDPSIRATHGVLHMQHEHGSSRHEQGTTTEVLAVIQGRRCIALTSFCAVCVERCPVPGAMQVTHGMPSVVPDVCTGCGICQQVCPAPTNAVLLLPRRRLQGRAVASPAKV